MWHPLSYAEACVRYPEQVERVVRLLRRSSSMHRDADPEALTWGFESSRQITSMTSLRADELLRGRGSPSLPRRTASTAERLQDEIGRTRTVFGAKMGRWNATSGEVPCPPEVVESLRQRLEAEEREEARIAGLSPEEREREAQENLASLRRSPGFVELRLPRAPLSQTPPPLPTSEAVVARPETSGTADPASLEPGDDSTPQGPFLPFRSGSPDYVYDFDFDAL